MQQPIRYYITKSGDEPTVRSVKVSLGSAASEDRPESRATPPTTTSTTSPATQDDALETGGVKRMVQDVIRKRTRPA